MNYENFKKILYLSDKGSHHGYERFYFSIFKELEFKNIRLLEIGVADGKSINIWNSFFKNANHIYGIGYKNFQTEYIQKVNDNTTIFMGDQSNKDFLNKFVEDSEGNFDIVIDDGSHVPSHIQTSFEVLWNQVRSDGYYIIEDIETSYWAKNAQIYGYSLENEGSIVEYFKSFVDEVNNEFRRKERSDICMISFVQNMIILKKIGNNDMPYLNRKYRFDHFLPPLSETKQSFDEFVERNKKFVLSYPVRNILSNTKYCLVIVEPRKHKNFEFVCKTMLRFTNKDWGLHVFHGNDNDEYVKDCLKGVPNVVYTHLNVSNLSIQDYNKLLTSVWFYKQIQKNTKKILIFQTDSCLLKEGVENFIDYDYIGAPWPHYNNEVGNGGFSLRDLNFCIQLCKHHKISGEGVESHEDVFFNKYSKLYICNVANYETACEFSCENIPTKTLPLGVHSKIHNILIPNIDEVFKKKFEMCKID